VKEDEEDWWIGVPAMPSRIAFAPFKGPVDAKKKKFAKFFKISYHIESLTHALNIKYR
jgi:hypothetical protein